MYKDFFVHAISRAFNSQIALCEHYTDGPWEGDPLAICWRQLAAKDSKRVLLVKTGKNAGALPPAAITSAGQSILVLLRGWFSARYEVNEDRRDRPVEGKHACPLVIEGSAEIMQYIELQPDSVALLCELGFKTKKSMLAVPLTNILEPLHFAKDVVREFQTGPAIEITPSDVNGYSISAIRIPPARRNTTKRKRFGYFAYLLNSDGKLIVDEQQVTGPALVIGGPASVSSAEIHSSTDAIVLDPG